MYEETRARDKLRHILAHLGGYYPDIKEIAGISEWARRVRELRKRRLSNINSPRPF